MWGTQTIPCAVLLFDHVGFLKSIGSLSIDQCNRWAMSHEILGFLMPMKVRTAAFHDLLNTCPGTVSLLYDHGNVLEMTSYVTGYITWNYDQLHEILVFSSIYEIKVNNIPDLLNTCPSSVSFCILTWEMVKQYRMLSCMCEYLGLLQSI